jgi:hypothetical protein
MAEVIGGDFWKPYNAGGTVGKAITTRSLEIGKTPGMFEARPPIDCPSSDILRQIAVGSEGGSGASVD